MLMVFLSLILLLSGLAPKQRLPRPFGVVDRRAHLSEIQQSPLARRTQSVVHGTSPAVVAILVVPPPLRLAL